MSKLFRGTGTALSTPFHRDGSIDFESFARLIEYQIDCGIESLIACGSTGESATMSNDERLAVIDFTVRRAREKNPSVCVIAGTGSNDTAASIALTRSAEKLGIDGALIVA